MIPDPRTHPRRYIAHHVMLNRQRYDERLGEGAQFYTVDGSPLPTLDSVRAEMRKRGEVVSR
jgi:hypothetical protein